jgi:murein DD-endopeptidase MepM/ murein hydrolase activator NlpD
MAQDYTIKYGDTLSGIAKNSGISQSDLQSWNGLADPNKIQAGATLKLYNPNSVPVAAPAATQTTPAAGTPAPTQPEQVTPYLNAVQNEQMQQQSQSPNIQVTPEVAAAKAASDQSLATLTNTQSSAPTPVKALDTFNQLREQYNIKGIEDDLNNLKTAEQEAYANARLRTNSEKGKRVGLGVIAGRVSEVEQQAKDEIDFIQRQINTKTNQAQAAYSLVDTIMKFNQTDFENAMQVYNTELNKNLKMYELNNNNYKDIRDFTEQQKVREQDHAKANLQIYANMVTSGALNWSNMDAATQTAISKLEIASGLGQGFIKNLQLPLDARIREIGTRVDQYGNKYADVIVLQPDGSMKVQSNFLGKEYIAPVSRSSSSSSSSSGNTAAKAAADAQAAFYKDADNAKSLLRKGGNWGEIWNSLKAKYSGISNADIDAALGVDPSWIKSGKPGWQWWAQNGSSIA